MPGSTPPQRSLVANREDPCHPVDVVGAVRQLPTLGSAILVALLCVAMPSNAYLPFGAVQEDALNDGWWWGNLTWEKGTGAIRWGTYASEDPGGRYDPPGSNKQILPYDFVAEPRPHTLYLNVSRHIQLDVAVLEEDSPSCKPAPQSGGKVVVRNQLAKYVEIFANQTRIAGTLGREVLVFPETAFPSNPPGYQYCRFRLPLERDTLEKGTVLSMKWTFHTPIGAEPSRRFGAGPEHESVLRLPIYSDEDAAWRTNPNSSSRLDSNLLDPRVPADVPVPFPLPAGAAAIAPFAGLWRMRRRPAWVIAPLFLASLALSGCVGTPTNESSTVPKADDSANATYTYVDAGSSAPEDAKNGTVFGRVQDNARIPVSSAYVVLLRTPFFGQTDGYGKFRFEGLEPRQYVVRVDKQGFSSLEVAVAVLPGKITQLEITLAPLDAAAADARPHRHDYWGEDARREVFNGSVGTCPPEITGTRSGSECVVPDHMSLPPSEGVPKNLVLPGTRLVEVALFWDPSRIGFDRLGLAVQANDDPSPTNHSFYFPRAPGEPIRIFSNWEMTDVGHQLFSTWTFTFSQDPDRYTQVDATAMTQEEAIRMIITLHKGVVPLEPPHPDHWKSGRSLTVDEGKTWTLAAYSDAASTVATDSVNGGCWTSEARYQYYTGNPSSYHHFMPWGSPGQIVPEGTGAVTIEVNLTRPANAPSPASYHWNLWYKTGNTGPTPFSLKNGAYQNAGPPTTLANDGKTLTWSLPVKAGEADGIYNRRSAWAYFLIADDPYQACLEAHAHALYGALSATARMLASKAAGT